MDCLYPQFVLFWICLRECEETCLWPISALILVASNDAAVPSTGLFLLPFGHDTTLTTGGKLRMLRADRFLLLSIQLEKYGVKYLAFGHETLEDIPGKRVGF